MNTLLLASALAPLAEIDDTLALSVPIVAITMPFIFVISVLAIRAKKTMRERQLQHETVRLLIEKGQPIPPDLLKIPEEPEAKKHDDRKTGLILIAVGIGLYFFFNGLHVTGAPGGISFIGLIPGLIGTAMLVNWYLNHKNEKKDEKPVVKDIK